MQIIIDTREQLPWAFDSPVVVQKLDAGDYSIVGFENKISIERKTLSDFIGSMTWERKRFVRKIRLLALMPSSCIVVESNLADVATHNYRSLAHFNSIMGSIVSICVNHKVPVFFASNRRTAITFAQKYLQKAYKYNR